MHRPNAPIALVDLTAAGVQLRPFEAVTIVRELLQLVARGDVAGVPSAHVIKLSGAGTVSVEGPVAAGGRPVMRAAQLLDSLLPVSDLGKEFKVAGGLKLVVARALGTLDLPPFPSLDSFADALSRFAATDSAAAITSIVTSWSDLVGALPRPAVEVEVEPLPAAQVQPFVSTRTQDVRAHLAHEPLTVSDIRRARRATGLPLAAVSERSHIPIGMLRQLEWGYFVNWPTGNYGRTQLVRYARSAGLDEQLVVETLLPLIEVAERPALVPLRTAGSVPVVVLDPVLDPIVDAVAEPVADLDAAAGRPTLPARPAANAAPPAPRVPRTVFDVEPDLEPAGAQVLQRTVVNANSGRRARAAVLAALAIPALLAIGLLPLWWAQKSNISMSELPSLVAKQVSGRPESTSAPTAATTRRAEPVGTASLPERGPERGPERAPEPAAVAPTPAVQAPPQRHETATGGDAAQYQLASDRAFSPSFASAGTAVFYHAKESDSAPLMRADTDGSGEVLRITRIVDDSANNWHVRPSPDGKQIAFDSDRDGARGVYLADADGQRVRRVSGEGWAAIPSWSPDGGTLAFVREDPALPRVWNLWTLKLSSGETRQITRHKLGQLWGGSWFPDGRHIAYSHETRLVIHDLEDGTERTFNTPIKGRLLRTPAVSPEGRRVVFQVLRNGTWLLDLQNGSMRRILEDPTAEEYTWSPDGRRLAYHSKRSGVWGVWVMASR